MPKANSRAEQWILNKHGFASVEDGVRQLSIAALRSVADGEPPVDLDKIAESRMVQNVVAEYMGARQHAVLIPEVGGFRIKINRSVPKVRQRFSLAHEIGHTYFFDTSGLIPTRPYQKKGLDGVEERWCDRFAAEILMPEKWLRDDVKRLGPPSMENFHHLVVRYGVSNQTAAIRIVQLCAWNVAVVAWQYRAFETPKGDTKAEKLRVLWRVVRRGLFIPIGDSVNSANSAVQHCYDSGEFIVAEEALALGSLRGIFSLECIKVAAAEPPYVLSLIHL